MWVGGPATGNRDRAGSCCGPGLCGRALHPLKHLETARAGTRARAPQQDLGTDPTTRAEAAAWNLTQEDASAALAWTWKTAAVGEPRWANLPESPKYKAENRWKKQAHETQDPHFPVGWLQRLWEKGRLACAWHPICALWPPVTLHLKVRPGARVHLWSQLLGRRRQKHHTWEARRAALKHSKRIVGEEKKKE